VSKQAVTKQAATKQAVTKQADRDAQALASRQKGRSFVKIAALLGYDSASDAVQAYKRALLRKTPEEQATLRAAERKRFDTMAKNVRDDAALSKADAAERLARIDRLRAALG
jgi:hypothetical protein